MEENMKITVQKGELKNSMTRAAVVGHFEDSKVLVGAAKTLDKSCNGLIGDLLKDGIFEGKLFETAVVNSKGLIKPERVIMVGLGKKDEFDPDKLRGAYSKAARTIRDLRITEFSTSLDFGKIKLGLDTVAESAVEGVMLGLYQFTRFKTVDRDQIRTVDEFVIVERDAKSFKVMQTAAKTAESISNAVYYSRDLVATPSNEMTPTILANRARQVARKRDIKVTVMGEPFLKRLGMNALLGVAKGSNEPPKLIAMEYNGGTKREKPVVLVGKGITFDSGGISIKPADRMEEMKSDMAGGSAVIGIMMAVADLRLPVNVVGIIPATENLPGGRAYKPGDVLQSMSGKTIEVISTDAEGRLILADTFTYADRYKPKVLIDMATLTGACIIALGDLIVGMMGTDEELKERIREASEVTGEKVWELPLPDEYNELIKSDVADVKNTGGRPGGAITAGLFLQKFVGDYPWVHLDIAGPALLAKERPYIPKGASGVGVRLMIEFLRKWKIKK
jgi:leucyl aminopeptidase